MATKPIKETTGFAFSTPPAVAPKTVAGSSDVLALTNFRKSKSESSFVADVKFGSTRTFYLCALPEWFAQGFDYASYEQSIADLKAAGEDGDAKSMKAWSSVKGAPYLYKSNVAAGKQKPSAFLEVLLNCIPELGDALAAVTEGFTIEAFNEMTPEEAQSKMFDIFETINTVLRDAVENGVPAHIGYILSPETTSEKGEDGKWVSTPTGGIKYSGFFIPDEKAVGYHQKRANDQPAKYSAKFPE